MGTAIALCLAAECAQVAISARSVGVGVVNCVALTGTLLFACRLT